jgi:hypothetical protein
MIFTASDAKSFCAKYVADGRDSSDPFVLSTINECIQILINEGDWKSTIQKMRFQLTNNSFALPSNVETVLKAFHSDGNTHSASRVWSMGYEMLDGGPGPMIGDNDHSWVDLIDLGEWPYMFPIGNTARKLVAFSTHADDDFSDPDTGATILVRGRGTLHGEVSPSTPGESVKIVSWKNSEEGRIQKERIRSSTNEFLEIDMIKKPVTKGYVSLYAYDADTYGMWIIAKMHPQETTPSYRRYKATGRYLNQSGTDCITCLVKMRYVPLVHDTDPLIIQNLPALRVMCQSIHARNMGDTQDALNKQGDAMRMLDQQLKSTNPPSNEFDVEYPLSYGDMPQIG